MKSCLILLVMLSYECKGTSPENTSRNGDYSPRFPCPVPEDIAPCVCEEATDGLFLNCDAVESDAQLADVFEAYFPVTKFYTFQLRNNEAVTLLGHGLNNVTFERIYVYNSNVKFVSDLFILETAQTVTDITISGTLLTENTFPFGVMKDVPNLRHLDIVLNDGFRWIPPFSSQSIVHAHFYYNGITSVDPGTFNGMPKVVDIFLHDNQLTELKSNSFTITPVLRYLYLQYNAITTVEPNAFVVQDNVTDASLDIYLYNNFIEELREESFGSVFPYLAKLDIRGNPLLCGCEIAWIITNPDYISKIDSDATCKDGTNLHDLDPAEYTEFC